MEENFDPRLGFVRRSDIKRYRGNFNYRPRLQSPVIRRLVFGFRPELITGSGNDTQSVNVRVTPFGIDWQEGDVRFPLFDAEHRLRATTEIDSERKFMRLIVEVPIDVGP